ncbi:MAG: hypothetical protein WCG47_05795 [Dermatophilaceae bacterium]
MTLRGIDWAVVLGASGCGAAILAGCIVFTGDTPPFGYLRLALLALVAASAFILDEPAAPAVDATPTPLTRRTALRATALAAPVTIWVLGLLAVEQRTALTPTLALLVEETGGMAVAVALAACLRMAGNDEPGEVIALICGAGILAILLLNPLPQSVPVFPVTEGWAASSALWASLTLTSVLVTISVSRDRPQRQRPRQ